MSWMALVRGPRDHLKLFRKLAPEKVVYDLAANPRKRKRTELKNGELPTLVTSSKFLW